MLLAKVFKRHSTYGLTCAVEKCSFGKKKLELLEFLSPTRQEQDEPVTLAHASPNDVERRVFAAQWNDIWLNEVRAGARHPQTKSGQEFHADNGVFHLL
jgi:hypothetical protein